MNRPLVPVAVCFLVVLTILESAGWILRPSIPSSLQNQVGVKSVYRAQVIRAPEPTPHGWRAVVGVDGVQVALTLPLGGPVWAVGDTIEFEARLKRPRSYKNPGGFDYRRSLERQGIVLTGFVSDPTKVKLLNKNDGGVGAANRLIADARRRISGSVFHNLSPETAGFLAALLVGDRSGISEDLWRQFRDTGTAHLIAISGQHIAIVAVTFYFIFFWLLKRSARLLLLFSARRVAVFLALGPVWIYSLIAGAPPSVLRAAVMATLAAVALLPKREVDPPSALAAAAIILGLWDPATPFSASFQLSFLAVLGILVLKPRTSKELQEGAGRRDQGQRMFWLRRWANKYFVLPLFMTTGAMVATAPLVAYRFNLFSLSGLWNNFWAVPACGFLLIATPVLMALGFFRAADYLTRLFLEGIELSSHHAFSFSVYPTGWEVFLTYGLITIGLLLFHKKIRLRPAMILACLCLAGFLPFSALLPKRLEVTFLDVGQGDSALVVAPSGKALLIDGGGFLIPGQGPPVFDVGERVILPYLGRRGIDRLDHVILSHPHPDHYGGLTAVLSTLAVDSAAWNGQTFPDPTFDTLVEKIRSKEVRTLRAGDQFQWEGVQFDVLYPPSIERDRSINDNSLVIRVVYGEVSFLLTGDIEEEGERFLALRPESIRSTVVKVPHHGSRTSSSIPFIFSVAPRYAVASLGEGNQFHFPHPDVLEKYERRGATVFRTDRDGAVTFLTDGHRITTRTASHDFR